MPVKSKTENKLTCPVCGMDVNENSEFKASSQGETFYFCSEEDKQEFKIHPSKYAKQKAA